MRTKTPMDAYEPLLDSEQITDSKKISKLLERFTKRYTPLTVQIPNHRQHYTSCIINVEAKSVLLDELLPATGHPLLLTERALHVRGKLDGIDIQFFTTLQHVGNKDNLLTYYMSLPKLLEYRQRRLNYRARIPVTMKLPVIIENINGEVIRGELHNLSYGGAGMIFLPDKTIMETGKLHECAIELPNGDWIYCTVELRHSKDIPLRKTQFVGAQFVGLLAMQSRLIGRCVSELEREFIRKQAAYK
jgi:c-di-GMP-binding flagellar brake protein YcgR